MPTQMEIEYWRNRYQRMSKERFYVANGLALVTHGVTQALDLVKVRQQMLQEGKLYHGLGYQRGDYASKILEEIHQQGGGMKKYFSSYEGFLFRTMAYTTFRVSSFLYFYDWINKDPRRYAKPEKLMFSAIPAGMIAGVLTNPFEIVYTRMQVNDMGFGRNYSSFADGLIKTSAEGALLRGAGANGM